MIWQYIFENFPETEYKFEPETFIKLTTDIIKSNIQFDIFSQRKGSQYYNNDFQTSILNSTQQ